MRADAGVRVCLLLAALVSARCDRDRLSHSTTLTIAIANSPATLDPGVALDEPSQKIQQLLFRSLLKIDDSLRVVPDLATAFERRDPLTYVATIPPGVLFHNGKEMTSADVAYTFNRFLDPSFVSGRKGAYRPLERIDVLDRYTVAFHLKQPSASFPINLVMSLVPDGTGAEAARSPIGSGPYRLAEFVPDDHVTLAPFSRAFGGAPANAGLTFRVVPDETMRGLELRNGSIDMVINDLSPDVVEGLRREPWLHVITAPGTDFAYLGFNLRDPVLADVRVRQAIGYAIDTDAIIKYLRRGLAQPAAGILPPMSWAFAPDAFRFTHDPAKARALLDEAGYGERDARGARARLHLSLKTSTQEAYRLQATVIQQNLADVGIGVDVRSYEFSTLMADVLAGNVQMYTLQWVGVTDPDMLRRAFHSSQTPPGGFNRGFYHNAEVDRLIDAATVAATDAERARLYQAAERVIAADAPYISLWDKTNVAVAAANLTGIQLSPTADFSFLARVSRAR